MAKNYVLNDGMDEQDDEGRKQQSRKNKPSAANEIQEKIDNAAKAVQKLYVADSYTGPFDLGDSLTVLYDLITVANGKANVTNKQVASYLKTEFDVSLTGQRVSSLRLTADFPEKGRDPRFSFKDYEAARKLNQKSKTPLEGKELAETLKSGEFKLPSKEDNKDERKPTLTISVKLDDISSDKCDPNITANGKKIDKPEEWMIRAAQAAVDALKKDFSL